jgi:hypothetical protein
MLCREMRWRYQQSNIKGHRGNALNADRPLASIVVVIATAASTPTIDTIRAVVLLISV